MYSYSIYAVRNTFLHNLSPVTKVVVPFSIMILTLLVSSPFWNAIILLVSVAMLVVAKIPSRTLKPYVRIVAFLSILFSVNWLLFTKSASPPIATIGWLAITREAINAILTSILRLLILVVSTIVLMGITSESELIEGLRKLKIPYVICFIFMMGIRLFPTLATDMATIREAQMSRGAEFERGGLIDRGKKLAALVIPLLVLSMRRTEVIATGIEARGFRPSLRSSKRTHFKDSRMRFRDKLLVAVSIVILSVFFVYQVSHGNLGLGATGVLAG